MNALKAMAADDLAEGLAVTVLHPITRRTESPSLTGDVQVCTSIDRSGIGNVLRIEEVSLPFVVLRRCTPGFPRRDFSSTVDLRETTLARLPDTFVKALLGCSLKKHCQQPEVSP